MGRTWLNKEELLQKLYPLNAHAEKWHRAGGNWYKIFKRTTRTIEHLARGPDMAHICLAQYR